ncbi:MAG: metal-dependent phosphoesterase [Candidatus Altiarchaeales archaeon]|nr:MAG: metal-dependent phosphoesterase [Candidatus Altiarchaeales archaeon]
MMKIDIHTHSSYSDGYNTPKEMVKYAKKIGLDGIAITDHNEIKGSLNAMKYASDDFKVIPGIEVSAKEGHIICLGIEEVFETYTPADEVIERVHELGGVAIAAHPYDRFRRGVGDLIFKLDFDAVELYNGHTLLTYKSTKDIIEKIELPVTGGSDAHIAEDIGCVFIEVDDDIINSIKHGNVKVVSNIKRFRIIKNFLKYRLRLNSLL